MRARLAALLFALLAPLAFAQATATIPSPQLAPAAAPLPQTAPASVPPEKGDAPRLPRTAERRHAAKLYLSAGKLFLAAKYEEAMQLYRQAIELDPTNADYGRALEVSRSHGAAALVQAAAQSRLRGDTAAARTSLSRALALDPSSPVVEQHLQELSDDAIALVPTSPRPPKISIGSAPALAPAEDRRSFHLKTSARQVLQQVFHAYGVETTFDSSVSSAPVRFEIDDATFSQAIPALTLLTKTFYVPIDPHRVIVAQDRRELRLQYGRLELETLHMPGLSANDLSDVVNLAKNIFGAQAATSNAATSTVTVRATPLSLESFNRTVGDLLNGKGQVLIDLRVIQLAHSREHTSGVKIPQSMSAFNVYAEEQSILNANSDTVKEIISSGLASANDPLAIIAILIASGQASSDLLSGGFALFGGGITQSALSPGSVTIQLSLNSSESHQLDRVQLRIADGESSTLRLGSRYPIQTSTYSSLTQSSSIAGLTTSGTSTALSSLLSSLSGSSSLTPQIEYQDLGLTFHASPTIMRNGRIALSLEMKITALSGSTLNGNPILNSRSYEAVVQVAEGNAVVLASELDRTETRAVSGTPGLDDIPGLSDTDGRDAQKSGSTLVIVATPHIVRSIHSAGNSPRLRIERAPQPDGVRPMNDLDETN